MSFTSTETILAAAVSLLLVVAVRLLFLSSRVRRLRGELAEAATSLEAAEAEIAELRLVKQRFQDFKADLKEAELTTRMRQPRPGQGAGGHAAASLPERYRYLHSLAKKGMPAAEIASILAISTCEADQLIALANLRRE